MNLPSFLHYLKSLRYLFGIILLLSSFGCCPTPKVPYVTPDKLKDHISSMGLMPTQHMVLVDTKKQTLALIQGDKIKKIYTISTSSRGIGQRLHSFKTPVGLHKINEKIGHGVPHYGIFHRRQYVGAKIKQHKHCHRRKDFISTRILRLEGLQPGLNKGKDKWGKIVDSEERAVYIHGTTMEWKLGKPVTKGCVHMGADDVINLFNEVPQGTLVWIN